MDFIDFADIIQFDVIASAGRRGRAADCTIIIKKVMPKKLFIFIF